MGMLKRRWPLPWVSWRGSSFEPDTDRSRASDVAWANRLLGRTQNERDALEQIARSDADTLAKLEAEARIAVLLADTARAERIDSILAEESSP